MSARPRSALQAKLARELEWRRKRIERLEQQLQLLLAAEAALLFRIPAHRDFVRSVRFDHQRIVSCGDDGRVCVFSFDGRGMTEERRSGELSDRARRVSIHGE